MARREKKKTPKALIVLVLLMMAGVSFGVYYVGQESQVIDPLGRDLSEPASRLIGHWLLYSRSENPTVELYFNPVDEKGEGFYYFIDNITGLKTKQRYVIKEQQERGYSIDFTNFVNGVPVRNEKIVISKDGQSGTYYRFMSGELLEQKMEFIDLKLTPD